MLSKRFFFKSIFLLLALEWTILASVNANVKTNELSENELAKISFNLMVMLESKLKLDGEFNQSEILLMVMLMVEIQKRINMMREIERERVENLGEINLNQR